MINVPELFGSMVFNEAVMKERLPEAVYREFLKTLEEGKELDISLANVIAGAMKDWALEKGDHPAKRRNGNNGIFGQGTRARGIGRFQFPLRRFKGHV